MLRSISLAILAATMSGAMMPAHAFTAFPAPKAPTSAVVDVQYGGGGGGRYSDRHYRWCADRYKSYDRHSNSYWTYSGERRQCRSPYM